MRIPALSLSQKAFFAISAIILPTIVTFAFAYKSNKDLLKRHILEDLTIMAEAFEGEVYQFLEMSRRRAVDFASDGLIREEMKKIAKGRPAGPASLARHLSKTKLPLDKQLRAIHLLTLDGRVAASSDVSSAGKDLSKDDFFLKGRSGTSVSEYVNPDTKMPELAISTPIDSDDPSGTVGVLATFIPISGLDNVLSGKFNRELGAVSWTKGRLKTMEVYLVNKDRLMITHSIFVKPSVLKQAVDTLPVRECLSSSREVSAFYSDYRSVEVAGASMCIPQMKWTLLVEYDADEALAPALQMRNIAILTAVFIACVIGVFFYFFFRGIALRLRAISNAANKIAGGDYDAVVPVRTRDEIGKLSGSFNSMASEIKTRALALQKTDESLKVAQHIARLGNWDWDIINNALWWSDEIYRIFGLEPQEFGATYEAFLSSVHPSDRDFVKQSVYDALYKKKPYSIDHKIVLPDNTERIVHEEAEVVYGASGMPSRMIGTVQDVTARKKSDFELKKLTAAIEQSVNIVFITDAKGNIEYVNPVFERITGYSRDDVAGQTPRILSSGEIPQSQYEELWNTITSGETWRGAYKNKTKTGGFYWCNSVISPIKDESGNITHFLAIQEDITEKKAAEEKTHLLASVDGLTGLINRSRFMVLLTEWIMQAKAGSSGALLLIDVDHFKFLNEMYGHSIGDEFLKRASRLLSFTAGSVYADSSADAARYQPLTGRLSGDEFALFFPAFGEKEGCEAAERIRGAMEEFRFAESHGSLTVSIGVVVYPVHGTQTKELFTRADAAMYRAKELGRNRCHLYRPEDHDLEKLFSRAQWRERIQKALKESRFEPWFQPILGLKDNTVSHYEALARLRDIDGKVLLPGAFIDIAERFGLVGQIDRSIIEKTIMRQSRSQAKATCFSMNISGMDLGDEALLEFIKSKISETGATPACLTFEITETAAIRDIDSAKKFIKSLKSLGCRISLDDFGVGFTSFMYLKEMAVDYIKIDGSFIKRLHENPDDQLFVKAMTDVARGLKIETIAEFVEKEETLRLLKDFNVDYAQGYLIGKPAPELLDKTKLAPKTS